MNEEICVGCNHTIGMHFQSVDGKVRCLMPESGTSTSGVLGMPYTMHCDCVNYVSERMKEQQRREQEEDARFQEVTDRLLAEIKRRKEQIIDSGT